MSARGRILGEGKLPPRLHLLLNNPYCVAIALSGVSSSSVATTVQQSPAPAMVPERLATQSSTLSSSSLTTTAGGVAAAAAGTQTAAQMERDRLMGDIPFGDGELSVQW